MKTPNARHSYRAVTAGSGFFVDVFESGAAQAGRSPYIKDKKPHRVSLPATFFLTPPHLRVVLTRNRPITYPLGGP
jgi:hypothetical protein